jgi:hypothetical protein
VTFGPYDEPPSGGNGDVVLALSPLADALPIAWDRYLRNRLRHPYQPWLEAVLSDPPADWPTVKSFWEHHHYDALVERWLSVVGRERLVVRVAEQDDDGARQLGGSQAEVVRRVNVAFHHREWPVQRYDQVIRRGVVAALLRRPDSAANGRVVTPAWAVERANSIATVEAARIVATGVRVDGDLAVLGQVQVPQSSPSDDARPLSLDAAADAVVAAVEAVATTWPQ